MAAFAEPSSGLYAGAEIGPNFSGSMLSVYKATKVDTDTGVSGGATIGWRFENGVRAEFEGGYRSNSVSSVFTRRLNGQLLPLTNVSGEASTPAVMANLAYDIPVRPFGSPLHPYVGLGIGYAWLDFNRTHGDGVGVLHLPQNNTFTGPVNVAFGDAGAFAYQAMVGASWPLRQLRGVELTMDYRYLGTARENLALTRTALGGQMVNGVVPTVATLNRFHVQDSAVMVGARFKLASP